jgi:hypothetical protein
MGEGRRGEGSAGLRAADYVTESIKSVLLKPRQHNRYTFFLKDPIYLQSVIIHSANGGKGKGWHVEEYSVALQNGSEIQFVPHRNHIT